MKGWKSFLSIVTVPPDPRVFEGSHQDVALAMNSSREVISRLLKQMEKKGIDQSRPAAESITPPCVTKVTVISFRFCLLCAVNKCINNMKTLAVKSYEELEAAIIPNKESLFCSCIKAVLNKAIVP